MSGFQVEQYTQQLDVGVPGGLSCTLLVRSLAGNLSGKLVGTPQPTIVPREFERVLVRNISCASASSNAGAAYSFFPLHRALILGELGALTAADRHVIRLHLLPDSSESLQLLERVFDNVLRRFRP